jgi:hypothetical protein
MHNDPADENRLFMTLTLNDLGIDLRVRVMMKKPMNLPGF